MGALKTKWDGQQILRWVMDSHARRVPTFVKDFTHCKTKVALLRKYAPGTAFEKEEAPVRVIKPVYKPHQRPPKSKNLKAVK